MLLIFWRFRSWYREKQTFRVLRDIEIERHVGSAQYMARAVLWRDHLSRNSSSLAALRQMQLVSHLVLYSSDSGSRKFLQETLTKTLKGPRVRVIRTMNYKHIARAIAEEMFDGAQAATRLAFLNKFARTLFSDSQILKLFFRVYIVSIDWGDVQNRIQLSREAPSNGIRVRNFSDVYTRAYSRMFGPDQSGLVLLESSTRLLQGTDGSIVENPLLMMCTTHLESVLSLQREVPCQALIELLSQLFVGMPLEGFPKYLLGRIQVSSKYGLKSLQQVVFDGNRNRNTNLVSHSQFAFGNVAVVHDACIIHGRFITTDSEVLVNENGADCRSDMCAGLHPFVFASSVLDGRVLLDVGDKSTFRLNRAIAGFGRCDDNWFHFVVETLPRIICASDFDSSKSPILVQRDLLPAGRQALKLLTHRELIDIDSRVVGVDELVVAQGRSSCMDTAFPAELKGFFCKETLHNTRQRLIEQFEFQEKPKRRVFMLRKSAYRRIKNLGKVTRLLLEFGFEPVDMSTLTLYDQIDTMKGASVVASQGGASITNLMFGEPGTRFIGFVGPNREQDKYWLQYLENFEIEPTFLVGERVQNGNLGSVHDDFVVDLASLRCQLLSLV